MKVLLWIALVVRLSSIFVIQTSYVPDETWQCTEVAHNLVFGYGHLTWEWKEGLRSYLHPLLFTLPYLVLKLLQIDTYYLVIQAPRLLQALIGFAGDVLMYRLVVKLYGHTQATFTLIMQLTSWYLYYVTPRPLVNNMETVLIILTLNLWPTRYSDKITYPAIALAAISIAIRPTLVIFWVFLGVHYLIKCPEKRLSSIIKSIIVGVPILALTVLLDSYLYGKHVFVFWNFLHFNLNSSSVYGAHPWHWYVTQGLPALLGPHIIFIFLAFYKHRDYPRQLLSVSIATILFFSVVDHKEFRFIQHLMPIFMIWAGLGLHWLSRRLENSTLFVVIMFHTLINVVIAFYIGFFHQRATISVIHDIAATVQPGDKVLFLTPCHATPLHSHVHQRDVTLTFLDCSPNLNASVTGHVHEEARFFGDPNAWWKTYRQTDVTHSNTGNEFVVMFEEVLQDFHRVLKEDGFKIIHRYFHAHVLVDDKLGNHLLLYKK